MQRSTTAPEARQERESPNSTISTLNSLSTSNGTSNTSSTLNTINESEYLKQRRSILELINQDDITQSQLEANIPATTRRKKSLIKRNATTTTSQAPPKKKIGADALQKGWWYHTSRVLTFYCPAFILRCAGKTDPMVQQAFREKLALCTIILVICFLVGFLTFGLNRAVCVDTRARYKWSSLSVVGTAVRGKIYLVNQSRTNTSFTHPVVPGYGTPDVFAMSMGKDIGTLFPVPESKSACKRVLKNQPDWRWNCTVPNVWPPYKPGAPSQACHTSNTAWKWLNDRKYLGEVYFEWSDLNVQFKNRRLLVYNGYVLDVKRYLDDNPLWLGADFLAFVNRSIGTDATKLLSSSEAFKSRAACLDETFRVGAIDSQTPGCVVTSVIIYASLITIISLMVIKFLLAVVFSWMVAWNQGDPKTIARIKEERKRAFRRSLFLGNVNGGKQAAKKAFLQAYRKNAALKSTASYAMNATKDSPLPPMERVQSADMYRTLTPNRLSQLVPDADTLNSLNPMQRNSLRMSTISSFSDLLIEEYMINPREIPEDPFLMHTILFVTCYSEGANGIRTTLDSLANTRYPSTHKLIFVVCDGIVTGAGETRATPDICLDMMEIDCRFEDEDPAKGGTPKANTYVAIAEGSRRKNGAQVYGGWYEPSKKEIPKDLDENQMRRWSLTGAGAKVPMIVVVKCGNEAERDPNNGVAKPGNRGKRDSQMLLMSFLSKTMFDDRLTELDYDLYRKIWLLTNVKPEMFETVLMVDADTRVEPECLKHMVAMMIQDSAIIGVCGETKIENKWDSWVSMIQVFEYYISHHFHKAFESVFGCVTCLPGCFSMYRIKSAKGDGQFVPILANPDIVEQYAEHEVPTLHMKNLLLLGEDRYLSTLMLKNFPKRKTVFVPQAYCKTVVPDKFSVLVSQRRRWINSTIHNLLELVLVRELCGTFCISMQFVIFMELVGTVVLPAAIGFTIYLLISSVVGDDTQLIPLILLAGILILPALMVIFTSRNVMYVFWMFVYLLSLPVWNFVLPLYAFWHFDDFTWGQTRKVEGERTSDDHGKKQGEFDGTDIMMKRFIEWECDRKVLMAQSMTPRSTTTSQAMASIPERLNGTRRAKKERLPIVDFDNVENVAVSNGVTSAVQPEDAVIQVDTTNCN